MGVFPTNGIKFAVSDQMPEHRVGVRYWKFDSRYRLVPPVNSSEPWTPGINIGYCFAESHHHVSRRTSKTWGQCSCGLYCFDYTPQMKRTSYFSLEQSSSRIDSQSVIGGIAYWGGVPRRHIIDSDIVRAKYAAVAALVYPPGATKFQQQSIDKVAQQYNVDVVKTDDLYDAVNHWVQERLPQYASRKTRRWNIRRETPTINIGRDIRISTQ